MGAISIKARITAGFGLIVALVAGLGVYAVFGMFGAVQDFTQYRGLSKDTSLVSQVQSNVLSMRIASKDFIIRGDEPSISNLQARAQSSLDLTNEAIEFTSSEDERVMLTGVRDELTAYRDTFARVTELQAQRNQLVGEVLNVLGPQIRETISEIVADSDTIDSVRVAGLANEKLLLGRLYVQRFLIENDETSAERAVQELNSAQSTLSRLTGFVSSVDELRPVMEKLEDINAYTQAFKDVAAVIRERNSLIRETLDQIGPRIGEQVESAKSANQDKQDTLGPQLVENLELTEFVTGIVAVIAVLAGLVIAWWISRNINIQISGMSDAMNEIAQGRLHTEIPALGQSTELGQMAAAVSIFKENAERVEQMNADKVEAEARAEREKAEAMNALADNFEDRIGSIIESLTSSASTMEGSASNMSKDATQTSEQSDTVERAAQSATENVAAVSSATEELSSSIREIGEQVARTDKISLEAVEEAEQAKDKANGLVEATDKIREIINMITEIAEQTNLLALNATIESARAGEAGKGFAVVASEVKNLASQTAKATGDIEISIKQIGEATDEVSGAIDKISKTIGTMSEISTAVAAAVEEQAAATGEIASSVQEAANGTERVSAAISDVSIAATRTRSAANDISVAAGDMSHKAIDLRSSVEGFLGEVRAR